jgi:hypothetical protein
MSARPGLLSVMQEAEQKLTNWPSLVNYNQLTNKYDCISLHSEEDATVHVLFFSPAGFGIDILKIGNNMLIGSICLPTCLHLTTQEMPNRF